MAVIDATIIALDVGQRRTGVSLASLPAKLAQPYKTFENPETIFQDITELVDIKKPNLIVIGLPRNNEGDDTPQSIYIRDFTQQLKRYTKVPTVFQDEAGTSQKAEAELKARRVAYNKGDVDALAATYILQDYLNDHGDENNG